MEQEDFAKLKRCAYANLRRTSRAVSLYSDNILQPFGLKTTQFTVLGTIAWLGPLTVTQLAEKLLMDQTSMTRSLKPLKEQGLIESRPGEDDGRTRLVSITRAGNQKLDEIMPAWEKAQAQITHNLGQARFDAFLKELAFVVKLVAG